MNDTVVGLLVGSACTLVGVFVPQAVQAWREERELARLREDLLNQAKAALLRISFLPRRK